MKINCTQLLATEEQKVAGVVDMPAHAREQLVKLLTFDELPHMDDIQWRASQICELVASTFVDVEPKVLLLGGAPFLMSTLEIFAALRGWTCVYAFSKRESVEELQHAGFVEV